MEIRPGILRTPDTCFDRLQDYDFPPNYVEIADPALGPLRMHYVDAGAPDAPVVLMLHGNPTWSYLYRHMIGPVAAAGYRVIAPDMIGFGKSDKPADRSAYGYDRFVQWMRQCVEALNLRRITLVCQDWGGPIGLRVLSEIPDRFDAVLATNTLLQNCDAPPLGVAGWPGEAIAAWIEMCRTSNDLPVSEFVAGPCVTRPTDTILAAYDAPFPDARYKAGVLQITCGIPVAEGAEGLEANRMAWRILEHWNRPFRTAFSDRDPATIGWEPIFQNRVAGARGQDHVRITDAGHFVQEEQGPALARALITFLHTNK
ncbi:haloalkane dehalogenase [Caenibius tardaugens NBRC 16725]|uniref:Haloalkane dehalogenase n=1 Tax=Caenibius tardaugens NBRC 16725 TaxID=1219035 RepID=U2ZSY5_9SPHN|nr:haloalkane dehalogenase [Caenibius tardaugens]AZI34940.1 alpha/beta fold hydrolase [Caenibius tardaugens NBRC 16725]GAD48484.1 haloalkane dehalogenase [Caenibius tardaugens NBRC 16725]